MRNVAEQNKRNHEQAEHARRQHEIRRQADHARVQAEIRRQAELRRQEELRIQQERQRVVVTVTPVKIGRPVITATHTKEWFVQRGWTYCQPCAEHWQWTHEHTEEYYQKNGFTLVDGSFQSAKQVQATIAIVNEPVHVIKASEVPIFVTQVPEVYRDEVVNRVCVRREVKWNKSEKKYKCVSHSHKHAFKRCTKWTQKNGEMVCARERQFFGVNMCMNWTDVNGKHTCVNNQVVYPKARCTKKVVFRGKKVCSCMKFYRPTEFCSKYSKRTGRCKSRKVFFGQKFRKIICKKTGKVVVANKKCGCLEKKVVFRTKYMKMKKAFKCTRCAEYKKKFGRKITISVKYSGVRYGGSRYTVEGGRGCPNIRAIEDAQNRKRTNETIKIRPIKRIQVKCGGSKYRVRGGPSCPGIRAMMQRKKSQVVTFKVVRPTVRVSVKRTCGRKLCRVVMHTPVKRTQVTTTVVRREPVRITRTKRVTKRTTKWYKSHGYKKIAVSGRVRWVKKSSWRYITSAEYQTRHIALPSVVKTVFSEELSSVKNYFQTIRVNLNKFSTADQSLISKCF